ncbi:MAG TPA: DUF4199 domain-containing protein [Flavobacteriaceae bacterium]|nr:DUF4199 domain-containing protein [Flavobacteriaceae bacterium]
METQQLSPGKFGVNYGLILGVILVLISVIMYVTGMQLAGEQWPIYLFYLIFLITIFYAISQFKKKNGNFLKLGEAIKCGLIVGIISALVFGVYTLIFNYVIDPGFTAQMMEVQREKMMENPNMTEEMMDQSMKFMEMFSSPWVLIAFWLAMSAFFALIYSLIAGLIMKKEMNQY